MSGTISLVAVVAILAGGIYFAYWAIQRTLNDTTGKSRNARRKVRRR